MTNFLNDCYNSYQNFNLESFCKDKFGTNYTEFAKKYPVINKVVIVANHILRLIPMIALMQVLPFSPLANCALMVAGSLFYRVTIERLCPLKFSLLSCFGAIAFESAKYSALGIIPIAAYAVSAIHSAYVYKPCCCEP